MRKKNYIMMAAVMMLLAVTALPAVAGQSEGTGQVDNTPYWLVGGLVINAASLAAMYKNFKTIFNEAYAAALPQYDKISLTVPSGTSSEVYAWMGSFPKMREWIGDRQISNLKAQDWTIRNKDWEATVAVPRNNILDDQYGIFSPIIRAMGASARTHPDEIIFSLLNNAFAALGYDGKAFFASNHTFGSNKGTAVLTSTSFGQAIAAVKSIKDDKGRPLFIGTEPLTLVVPPALEEKARTILNADYISVTGGSTQNNPWKGASGLVISAQLTSATAWFLLVEFNGLKPLIFQQRQAPEFVSKEDPQTSDHVFMKKEYLYGADSRDNAGYGLPQLAYGSDGSV